MLAVVTGGTGFVGSHIVDELLRRGMRVRCLIRPSSNTRWLRGVPVELVEVAFDDQESVNSACAGADYIVHCAGVIAASSPEEYQAGNKGMTETMLRASIVHAGSLRRFLHVSSLSAVGPAKSAQEPVTSITVPHPITEYGRSKLAAEQSVIQAQSKIPCTIIRPPAVYGERDEATVSVFQAMRFHLALLMGFSTKWVSLIYVGDLVRGMADAMIAESTVGRTYALGGERSYSWAEITKEIGDAVGTWFVRVRLPHAVVLGLGAMSGLIGRLRGTTPVFNYEKGIDFIQEAWVCSNEEATRDFNYHPCVSLRDGIRTTTDWYRNQGWL